MTGPIVVGVDGTETASHAAATAAELAGALGVTLHVICAYDKNRVAEREANKIRATAPDLVSRAAQGSPGDALVEVARSVSASIIVVGNKRVQGISRVLGSVASDVAQHAPCDVHIVKTS